MLQNSLFLCKATALLDLNLHKELDAEIPSRVPFARQTNLIKPPFKLFTPASQSRIFHTFYMDRSCFSITGFTDAFQDQVLHQLQ